MDPASLNSKNISIHTGKHFEQNISNIFSYHYDKNNKRLTIQFSDPKGLWGSGDGITVVLSGEIQTADHQKMGKDYRFGFRTR